MMCMAAEFAYIMLVPIRKKPMRFMSQSHDKLIYIRIYLSIGAALHLILLDILVNRLRIYNKVGFITYEDLCLIDKGGYIK